MTDFVTIEDAIRLTGTSDSTIRRFLRSLDHADKMQHTRKTGKKVLVRKVFLLKRFGVPEDFLQAKEAGQDNDLINFQRHQLQDASKQIGRLTDQNDVLLQQLQKSQEDLKASWSIISGLKDQLLQLSTELKSLKAPEGPADRSDRLLYIGAIVISVAAAVALIWYVIKSA